MSGGPYAVTGTLTAGGPAPFPARPRRRPMWLAVGVAMAALGAMIGAYVATTLGHREMVVVTAGPVAVGSVIRAGDLAVAPISADTTVPHVPARDLAGLVGKIATADLVAGAVLAPGQLADSAGTPGPGQAVAVLVLPANRLPAIGLRAGDPVLLVLAPGDPVVGNSSTADPSGTDPGVGSTAAMTLPAMVVRVGAADPASLVTVDVLVAEQDVATVAARAADGKVSLALRSRSGR